MIEKVTELKYKETVFDSNVDNWKEDTSVFSQKVYKKQKLAFVGFVYCFWKRQGLQSVYKVNLKTSKIIDFYFRF